MDGVIGMYEIAEIIYKFNFSFTIAAKIYTYTIINE